MIPIIAGISGLTLTGQEAALFKKYQPNGFILFKRNCDTPKQVKKLVQDLKNTVNHTDVPVLIDQEGGRVMRLTPPEWPERKPASDFEQEYNVDPKKALKACLAQSRSIAKDLSKLGITVNCTPVLDIPAPGSHQVIGDRAYGTDPEKVIALSSEVVKGHLQEGILPVIKHIPGHGRALSDSHEELPYVHASLLELEKDFAPFRALSAAPWAMTAHIVYEHLDKQYPATLSSHIIQRVIRRNIGFEGVLISDDINMKALKGNLPDLANNCIEAGCDLTLHCSGIFDEMAAIFPRLPSISDITLERLQAGFMMVHTEQRKIIWA